MYFILPLLIIAANGWFWLKRKFSFSTRLIIAVASAYLLYNAWRNYQRLQAAATPNG